MGGQVEFVVTYTNFFLEIKAKSRKKSRFNSNIVIPDLQYAFEQLCIVHFVEDTGKDHVSLRDLVANEELAKKLQSWKLLLLLKLKTRRKFGQNTLRLKILSYQLWKNLIVVRAIMILKSHISRMGKP